MEISDAKLHLQKGFTLIETMLVLGFAGIILAGATGFYLVSKANSQSTQLASDVESVSGVVDRYLMGYGRPAADTDMNQMLIDSGKLPSGMRTNGQGSMLNTYGGQTDVAYANNSYTVTLTGIPRSGCISFLTNLPSKWTSVSVSGAEAVTEVPLNVQTAQTSCSGEMNSIVLTRETF